MFYFGKTSKTLNDLIDDFFGLEVNKIHLKSDIIENNDSYELIIEAPGIEKNDIQISYESNLLTVTIEKKNKKENANYIQKEIKYGSISRKYFLENIDIDKIKATYNNGVLNVLIPKLEKVQKTINIEIK